MRKHLRHLVLIATLIASGCTPTIHGHVDVRNACSTFVSELAPRRTPELRQGKGGLELILSFTPAKDSEADSIRNAVRKGPVELMVHPGMEQLQALGEENGYLILSVSSEAHAKQVEQLLCF